MPFLRKNLNQRIKRRTDDRMTTRKKSSNQNELRISRARVADMMEEEYSDDILPFWKLLLTILLGCILLFPCAAITKMTVSQIIANDILWNLRGNELALFFSLGGVLTIALLCIPLTRHLLLPVYVFGHEFTHAIFVWFCYGKVSAFNASADGGYIIANRANILVSLSPYIFPFWTIVFALIYSIGSVFTDLTPALPYFFLLYGASWLFNLFWTIWMIPLGQSDLSANGTFFSLTLIYLANFYGLSLLIEFMKITPSFSTWLFDLMNVHSELFENLTSYLAPLF